MLKCFPSAASFKGPLSRDPHREAEAGIELADGSSESGEATRAKTGRVSIWTTAEHRKAESSSQGVAGQERLEICNNLDTQETVIEPETLSDVRNVETL